MLIFQLYTILCVSFITRSTPAKTLQHARLRREFTLKKKKKKKGFRGPTCDLKSTIKLKFVSKNKLRFSFNYFIVHLMDFFDLLLLLSRLYDIIYDINQLCKNCSKQNRLLIYLKYKRNLRDVSLLKVSKQVYARCTYACPYEWFNGQRVTIIGHQIMHIIDNNCCCPRQKITCITII